MRTRSLMILLAVALGVAMIAGAGLLAQLTVRSEAPLVMPGPSVSDVESPPYILVIARQPEKQREEDALPHRNSPIALYKRSETGWEKTEGDLITRSTSTCEREPEIVELVNVKDRTREFGFVSVPDGAYSLVQVPWRDTGRPAFLISQWGSWDGTIPLNESQHLQTATLIYEGESARVERKTVRSSVIKQGSYLHSTHTQFWSFGDSRGCINLYAPQSGDDLADYGEFLAWFDKYDLIENSRSRAPLVIVSGADFLLDGTLPQSLETTFWEDSL